jgi:LuxR family maltose regulon positive regulatory protein
MVIEGAAEVVEGRLDRGDAILAQAVEVGTDAGALPGVSTALAERSLMAIERGDWRAAGSLADRALGVLTAGRLEDYIMSSLVHAVAARTALHRGDLAGAGNHLARAARLRPLLTYAVPWGAVQTLLQLGQAYLALDDLAGARAVLGQARDIPQLATHLSFTEIGQRLYLSKHTVKTQAISIYRKLGASSRSEAVQRVQEVGLLAG